MLHQGRLPGAVLAEDRDGLAAAQGEVDIADSRLALPVGIGQPAGFDHRLAVAGRARAVAILPPRERLAAEPQPPPQELVGGLRFVERSVIEAERPKEGRRRERSDAASGEEVGVGEHVIGGA